MRDAAQYRLVAYAVLLIVLMIVRPAGILGHRELRRSMLPRWLSRRSGERG
jgi:ABC-type branched-subunit amino acid transport system permease subunit